MCLWTQRNSNQCHRGDVGKSKYRRHLNSRFFTFFFFIDSTAFTSIMDLLHFPLSLDCSFQFASFTSKLSEATFLASWRQFFTGCGRKPHAQIPTWRTRSLIYNLWDWLAQLYPQPLGTHFNRLLRPAWAKVGLFFNPGHHTGYVYSYIERL